MIWKDFFSITCAVTNNGSNDWFILQNALLVETWFDNEIKDCLPTANFSKVQNMNRQQAGQSSLKHSKHMK